MGEVEGGMDAERGRLLLIPPKPNWNEVIVQIKRATKWRDKDIATKVGCSSGAITNIKNRLFNDVRFSIGAAILNLHAKVVKNDNNK